MEGLIKTLADVAKIISLPVNPDYHNILIEDLEYNSSAIKKNNLFVAIQGFATDGNKYIKDAISKGAVAIITDKKLTRNYSVPVLKVKNSREALSILSDWFYDYPSQKMKIIGITGTNGKTTISYLLEKNLQGQGYKTAIIGTIRHKIGKIEIPSHNTTPESLDLNRLMARMVKAKVNYVIMEVSSHSLVLNRVDFCAFDGAIFTNLTEDHFDFHKNFQNYYQAKKKLFELLRKSPKSNKVAVINIDDQYGHKLYSELKGIKKIGYSIKAKSQYQGKDIKLSFDGIRFKVGGVSFFTALIGRFNIYNVLSTIAITDFWNMRKVITVQVLKKFKSVEGRLEKIQTSKGTVFIDYAHTDDALKNVLETLNEIEHNKIITVFGCGGDRDKIKRPKMGRIAEQLSDIVIVTSDNPRTEKPKAIIDDILKGMLNPKQAFVISDRKKAIKTAYNLSTSKDIILIAGKGHETYQIIGKKQSHFSDKEEVSKLLMNISGLLANIKYTEVLNFKSSSIGTITINSKEVKKNSVFIALDGQKHKGIDFINDVIRQGAVCLVAEKKYKKILSSYDIVVILVDDIMIALHQIAEWYKSFFDVYTIAVTGSNGKTTTKEITSHILKGKYNVLKNEKNYNNEIGVPITIFRLRKQHQVLVIELGINHIGEMEKLAKMVKPEMALITNIGLAHLEFLKDKDTVAKEKFKILKHTKSKYLMNYNEVYHKKFRSKKLKKILVDVENKKANYFFSKIEDCHEKGYNIFLGNKKTHFSLYGNYNLKNLIMAIGVAREMKMSENFILKRIQSFHTIEGRSRIYKNKNIVLLDESYNSNFSSLSLGIRTISQWSHFTKKIALLGDMRELGETSSTFHSLISEQLHNSTFSAIFLTGKEAANIKKEYSGSGFVFFSLNQTEIFQKILTHLNKDEPILIYVKGSRANHLEEIVQMLIKKKQLR